MAQFNKLIGFRQAVYRQVFTQAADAQFELLEAMLAGAPAPSFVDLSLSPFFRRRWPSLYAALADGQQDLAWLAGLLAAQLPTAGRVVLSVDGTAWPHPQASTLPERRYVYSPRGRVSHRPVVVGHAYSLLCWVAVPDSSWALPLSVERIPVGQTEASVGAQQVLRFLAQCPPAGPWYLLVADAKYGSARFLRPLQGAAAETLVRLRKDRVLFGPPGPYRGRGRRERKHGVRFAFKDPTSWGPPAAEVTFDDPRFGQVRLRRWDHLHMEEAADLPFSVLLAQTHCERAVPDLMWLAYLGTRSLAVQELWAGYQQRWPVEPAIRFRKQRLGWILPHLQATAACDHWTQLVSLAQWQLWLARDVVADQRLPWQKPQPAGLTPQRVQRGLAPILAAIGTPAQPPQRRGNSPGWPQGRVQKPRTHYPVVQHSLKRAKKQAKAAQKC